MRTRVPPSSVRLYALLANAAAHGLILYSAGNWVCTIGWDPISDTFALGQCLKGHIHRYCCDLPPDGEHFIYSAFSHRYHNHNPPQGRPLHWTAISRAPYLKAIGFWPDNWAAGVFLDNQTFHLPPRAPIEGDVWPKDLVCDFRSSATEVFSPKEMDYGLSFNQAIRNGWQVKARCDAQHIIGIMEKQQTTWTLRRFSRYGKSPRGNYNFWEWYNVHNFHGETLGGYEWEWADFDGDRLVWAQTGQLFAMKIWEDGRGDITQLADVNNWNPQAVQAPY